MNEAAAVKKRLIAMLAIDMACFVLAAIALVGWLAGHIALLGPVFAAAIVAGVGTQVWFIVAFAREGRDDTSKA